jgi:hypothetical protein
MKTLTEEQLAEIANKQTYIEEKASLLKEYKSYEINIEYADDEFEEDMILQKREKLAVQIKALGEKIRNIESLEA